MEGLLTKPPKKLIGGTIMKRSIFCLFFFLFGFALLSGTAQATSHEFFKGKSIRLVVGTSVGGAMDDWGRL